MEELVDIITKSKYLLALTGSGISAESGIPTFRGKDGLWKEYRPEELATLQAFKKNPTLVWEWYDWRRSLIARASPNDAHKVLAWLEERDVLKMLITQNVDGLHRRAGNKKIIELHGNIWRMKCMSCNNEVENYETPLKEIPPKCNVCHSMLRPSVVWFGESLDPFLLNQSILHSSRCDVMMVIGTSAVIQPAASLPIMAKNNRAVLIEINPSETPISPIADYSLRLKASVAMKSLVGLSSEI